MTIKNKKNKWPSSVRLMMILDSRMLKNQGGDAQHFDALTIQLSSICSYL